jgi:capsular exopolysaccharide synthesis family protein
LATHRDHEGHDLVLHYWRILTSHIFVVLATFAAGVIVAAVVAFEMPPVYRASALVLVEDDMSRMAGIQGVYPDNMGQSAYCLTQAELIKSRSVLRAAAEKLGRWEEFRDTRKVASALYEIVEVVPVGKTTLIRVSAEWPDPKKVDDIANAVVDAFREESIQRRRSSSNFAAGWLDEQINRLGPEVQAAEDLLSAFQKEHKILSLDRDNSIISQRLVQLNQDVAQAERARIDVEAELAQIEAAAGDPRVVEFLPAVTGNRAVRDLDSAMLSLQDRKSDMLGTVKPDHPDVQALDARIADIEARRREKVKGALAAVKWRLDAARVKERTLRQALAEQERKALALNEKLIELSDLRRKVERARELYEPRRKRWDELGLVSGLNTVPVQIVDRAEEPADPVKPRKRLILAAGAALGLLFGLQLALVLDRSYSKVRSPEDIERLAGLRTMGTIPHMEAKEGKKLFMACHFDRKSAAAEAYRSIRTGLLLATSGDRSPVFLITSAVDQEGKTTTALNIASALAQTGKRVLVVDADMRRSSMHKPFGIEKGQGLSTCLADGVEAKEVVHESEVPSLSIITAGPSPENPSELLGSKAMSSFLAWARRDFDFIVIDSPPVAAVTDASVLAPVADGVLMVVRADRTPRRAVGHGRDLLAHAKASVIGAVLNDVPRQHSRYYGYGYGYGYGYYRRGYYNRYYGESDEEAEQKG